jgi:hypothetical protein
MSPGARIKLQYISTRNLFDFSMDFTAMCQRRLCFHLKMRSEIHSYDGGSGVDIAQASSDFQMTRQFSTGNIKPE